MTRWCSWKTARGSWSEYKSIAEWGFKQVKKEGPKDDHKKQALTYAYCLTRYPWTDDTGEIHEPLGVGLIRARVVYLDKSSMDVSEWFVYPTRDWDEQFEAYLAKLQRYKQDGKALPLRLDDKTKYPCSYCSFKTRCWEIDSEGVSL